MVKKEVKLSFEDAMVELEEIVSKLEKGDVPLEEAIEYFKSGMKLSKLCHDKLEHVEKEMAQILQADGELKPFQLQEE